MNNVSGACTSWVMYGRPTYWRVSNSLGRGNVNDGTERYANCCGKSGGYSETTECVCSRDRETTHYSSAHDSFHHSITLCLAGSFAAAGDAALTPARTTGRDGLRANARYGFHSHVGAMLCEMTRASHMAMMQRATTRGKCY